MNYKSISRIEPKGLLKLVNAVIKSIVSKQVLI